MAMSMEMEETSSHSSICNFQSRSWPTPIDGHIRRVPQNLSCSLCKWSSSSSSIQGMEGLVLPLSTLARMRGRSSCPCHCPLVCCTMSPECATSNNQAVKMRPDGFGRFGKYGGKYVPETLMHALSELESAFYMLLKDRGFRAWSTAIFAGVSFFALDWFFKGSNPFPSISTSKSNENNNYDQDKPQPNS